MVNMERQLPMPQGLDLCVFPAGVSPDGTISDFVNVETLVPVLLSVTIILAAFAIVFSVCRLFANKRKLWWSDYCVAIGLMLSLAHTGLMFAQTRYARHQWDVRACWYDGTYTRILFAQQIILGFSLFFSKTSIFLLFQQIFEVQRGMLTAIRGGIIFTALIYFTNVPVSAVLAAPHVGETWASVLTSGRPERALLWGVVQAALAIVLDLFIFILPIPSIMRLNLSSKRKMQLLAVFLTAMIGVVASILSLVYRVAAIDTNDGTWQYTSLVICNVVENDVALIVSSTPGLANFVRVYLSELGFIKSITSTFTGSSSRTRINKRGFDHDPNRPRTKNDSNNQRGHEFDRLSDTVVLKTSQSEEGYDGIVRTVRISQETRGTITPRYEDLEQNKPASFHK